MSPRPPPGRRWTVRLYRLLLGLYDPVFRERHGGEMVRLFVEKERDARARGRRIAFLAGAAADAVKSGLATRFEGRRRRKRAGAHGALSGRDESRGGGGMDSLLKDARYALRSLLRSPGFTAVAVLTIALGIGANTAIFSVVRAVLLEPLPYEDPGELVMVWGEMENRGVTHFPFSPPDVRDLSEGTQRIEEMGAVFTFQQALTGDGADPVQLDVGAVTWNFFDVLGVEPLLGRGYTEEDDLPNPPGAVPGGPGAHPNVVLLSHALWQQRFGGDPEVVGRTVEVGGALGEVVGVMPPDFELLIPPTGQLARNPDLWITARVDYANAPRNNVFLVPVARLADGATLEQARDEVARVAAEMAVDNPVMQTAGWDVRLEPLQADLTAHVRPVLLALFGAVVFVLLVACANVANLLLVRSAGRTREVAVRAALGGTRGRLVRQLLLESGILSLGGALLGLLLAVVGIDMLLALQPADLPRADGVAVDGTVLAFTLLAAVGAAAVFGVLPALHGSRVDLADSLKDRGRAGATAGGRTVRNAVVVGEVALSLVLLIGAGLMVRSFVELTRVDPGYEPEGVLAFQAAFPFGRYPQAEDRSNAFMELRRQLEAIPGVEAASAAFPLPLNGPAFNGRYGGPEALEDSEAFRQAAYRSVLPGYFEAMGTELREGRTFTEADYADSAAVVVVDEKLARTLFPDRSAVGERFLIRALTPEPQWVEIVGVVEHQRAETLDAEGMETVYFHDRYMGSFANSWVVRAGVEPLSLVPEVRRALGRVDPDVPVAQVRPFADDVAEAMGATRFALTLIGLFGVIALILAAVGLYGVLSYVVRQRTAEIGVRLAFGAERATIQGMVVRQGLTLAVVGVAVGVAVALPLSRVMASLLVGIEPTDPMTYLGISALFVGVAALACWIPARRATRVDPVTALREE